MVATGDEPESLRHTHMVSGTLLTVVEGEAQLFEELCNAVRRWGPDLLIAYEPQQLSWGYLIDRSRISCNLDLCTALSRTPSTVSEAAATLVCALTICLPCNPNTMSRVRPTYVCAYPQCLSRKQDVCL